MAFPDLAVNAIYTVLCLVPGFVSVKTVTYTSDVEAELSEFEKSTWSFVASGISLSASYFLYTGWLSVRTGEFALVRSLDIGWVDLVAGYPVLVLVALLVGYVGSMLVDRLPIEVGYRESTRS